MNAIGRFEAAQPPRGSRLGTLHGIGVGPGDPELMTVRAVRILRDAPVVAYFRKVGGAGIARSIAAPWLRPGAAELPLDYPVTTELHFADAGYVRDLSAFYADAAERLAARLATGDDVALLCEGDPMLYGSFMHLMVRLRQRFTVAVTAGVSGMAGCWSAAALPMTWGDDVLAVLPGTLDRETLTRKLRESDAAVVMKLGTNFPKVRAAVEAAGRLDIAVYVERGTMAGEIVQPLRERIADTAPYFAMILMPGAGRRP